MPCYFLLTCALFLISISFTTAVTFLGDAPVVELSLGKVQGATMQSFRNRTFYAFRGIRYAQSPVGQLRFANPLPETSWGDEVLQATTDSLVCPQPGEVSYMSEDCLKINVYTKNFEEKLPVMVYIHGGANVLGSGHSSYEAGPQYLLDQDVVFVAFNYRLGALGFLSTNSSETKGNFGYLDQVMALEWVRDHISLFGGDPEMVTIFGMSAGSMAVSLHLASPLSAGLFHRAILMSGSATNHFDIDNLHWTRRLARELGCPMYDPTDVVACLRNESWARMVEVSKAWETYQLITMRWNYEIDGHFLPSHPTELIAEGNFNKVPLLISYTANEFDYNAYVHLGNQHLLHDMASNFVDYAPELFLYRQDTDIGEQLKNFYLGGNATEINAENIEDFGRIFSDAYIGHGVHRLVQLARPFTPVYYMRTDYVGDRSLTAPLNEDNKPVGVAHADDLQYVMPGYWYGTVMAENDTDVFMMERMTSWFSHFAKTGTPLNSTDMWPPCNLTHLKMLYNGVETQVGAPGYSDRYVVWDELFPTAARSGGAAWKLSFVVAIVTGVASSRLIPGN
ncbi:juvenile hormone esterase [Drosophila teissieri]|uniref:juvenile hormone esterase n=1 Tax=Drosophila teissieri TaxID=7243 RepID=UPI001CB9DD66|nr:juvenile hormone esterase [Drosophila teissieri]